MAENKQSTFAELIADSKPEQDAVTVGDHTVTIQELCGADRFAIAGMGDDDRWTLLLWVAMRGLVKPKPKDEAELEKLKPEWLIKISTAILHLSGIDEAATVEAEKASASGIGSGGS